MKNAATVAALLISLLPQKASARKKPHEAVVGFIFAGRGGPLDGSTIAAKKMTRINYAFFGLQDGLVAARSANDAANLGTLVALKKIKPQVGGRCLSRWRWGWIRRLFRHGDHPRRPASLCRFRHRCD